MKVHPASYAGRTLRSITVHCQRRGIEDTDEIGGVVAALCDEYGDGKPFDELDDSVLKRISKNLEPFLTNRVLGGKKRRGNEFGLTTAGAAALGVE